MMLKVPFLNTLKCSGLTVAASAFYFSQFFFFKILLLFCSFSQTALTTNICEISCHKFWILKVSSLYILRIETFDLEKKFPCILVEWMFASNTTSITGKISPFVLHVAVCQRERNCFCLLMLSFFGQVWHPCGFYPCMYYVIENENLEIFLDLYCGNKACMNSLVINDLSSVCLCLAPKFDRIKHYKDSAFVRIAMLLNQQPHPGMGWQTQHVRISEALSISVIHCAFSAQLLVARYEVLPLAQTNRAVRGGWPGLVLQKGKQFGF